MMLNTPRDFIKEKQKRENLLKAAGLDTEGFGLLNVFFLYDELSSCFGRLASVLHSVGLHRLALGLTDVTVRQDKKQGLEIHQTISVTGCQGTYRQSCWIHDQDPDFAKKYILDKYNLVEA